MEPEAIEAAIRAALPDAEVVCYDLTGTQDHWQIEVTSAHFKDLPLLRQHRLVKEALAPHLLNRTLHALSLKTRTP